MICISTKGIRSGLSLTAVFCVVAGFLISENAFDEGHHMSLKAIGLALYALGWILVSVAATMTTPDGEIGNYAKNGLPALFVLGAAMLSMLPLAFSKPSKYTWVTYLAGALYFMAWLVFAITAGYRDGPKYDSKRASLFILGALLVTGSMPVLFNYRKYRIATFSPTDDMNKVAVYNPGLAMFVAGWGLVALGLNYNK